MNNNMVIHIYVIAPFCFFIRSFRRITIYYLFVVCLQNWSVNGWPEGEIGGCI